MVESDLGI